MTQTDQDKIASRLAQMDEKEQRLYAEAMREGFENKVCSECNGVLLAYHHFVRCQSTTCPMKSRDATGHAPTQLELMERSSSEQTSPQSEPIAPPLEQFTDPATGQPLFCQRREPEVPPEEFKETYGTHDNTLCPHCGRSNGNISQGVLVTCGRVTMFRKLCHYCGKTVHYRARHEIAIVASTHPKV